MCALTDIRRGPALTLLALALALGIGAASAQTTEPAAVGPEGPPMPISLSISGGVSLGAYEAGVAWGAVRYLRAWGDDPAMRPDPADGPVSLVGVTGASAGAINTLLTALAWCSRPDGLGGVDDNLLRDTWVGVGLDALLPPSGRDGFLPLDGALTRNALTPGIAKIQAAIDRGDYRPHCRVPLAFTVTRGVPWELKLSGLTVSNQRFALPLELVIDAEGHAWFRNHVEVLRNEAMLGQYLFLAERSGDAERAARGRTGGRPPPRVVPADLVIQSILASSAFPLAFSPVSLTTCLPVDRCPAEHPPAPVRDFGWLACGDRAGCDDFSALTCEGLSDPGQPLAPCTSRFVDGGFFDNVPLGVAMAQAELHTPAGPQRRPVDYLYFDPDVRRLAEAGDRIDDLGDRGRSRVTSILGEVTVTARSYELSTVLRFARFNRPLGWYPRRFGELVQRSVDVIGVAGGDPTGDARAQLGGPLVACLVALEADTDGCAPLPEACLALSAVSPAATPPSGPAEACLPADHARWTRALDRLGRRLDCNARRTGHYPRLMARLPAITRHVEAWFAGLVQCREQAGVRTMLHARMVRDLDEAAATIDAMSHSVAEARTLTLPRRFAEVAASQLRNFGALFDEPMRRHDYAVGLFDAMTGIAAWHCETRARIDGHDLDPAGLWACGKATRPAVRAALGIDEQPYIAAIVDALTAFEEAAVARAFGGPMPAADPYARCPADDDGPCAVQRALARCAPGDGRTRVRPSGGEACLGRPEMSAFVAALDAEGYRPQSLYMRRLMRDDAWWTGPVEAVLERLADIEASEADRARARAEQDPEQADVHRAGAARAEDTRFGLVVGGAVVRATEPRMAAVELDPSLVPDAIGFHPARLLPFRIGVDALNGGAFAGWEPRFGAAAAHLRLSVDPVMWQGLDRGMASRAAPLLALRPWSSVFWGALSVGPRIQRPWDGDLGWVLGGTVGIDVLSDRLRFELDVGEWTFGGEAIDTGVPVTLGISLLDLPGLVWLMAQ